MSYYLLLVISKQLHKFLQHHDTLCNITHLHILTPQMSLYTCIFSFICMCSLASSYDDGKLFHVQLSLHSIEYHMDILG